MPLREYVLPKRINIDLEIPSEYGLVPEYEERETAVYVGYTWEKWLDIEYSERAKAIAHYRTHLAIEAHIEDAVDKKTRHGNRKS